jgi:hypothetical protein
MTWTVRIPLVPRRGAGPHPDRQSQEPVRQVLRKREATWADAGPAVTLGQELHEDALRLALRPGDSLRQLSATIRLWIRIEVDHNRPGVARPLHQVSAHHSPSASGQYRHEPGM